MKRGTLPPRPLAPRHRGAVAGARPSPPPWPPASGARVSGSTAAGARPPPPSPSPRTRALASSSAAASPLLSNSAPPSTVGDRPSATALTPRLPALPGAAALPLSFARHAPASIAVAAAAAASAGASWTPAAVPPGSRGRRRGIFGKCGMWRCGRWTCGCGSQYVRTQKLSNRKTTPTSAVSRSMVQNSESSSWARAPGCGLAERRMRLRPAVRVGGDEPTQSRTSRGGLEA